MYMAKNNSNKNEEIQSLKELREQLIDNNQSNDRNMDGIVNVKGYGGSKTINSYSEFENELLNLDNGYSNLNSSYEENTNDILKSDLDRSDKIGKLENMKNHLLNEKNNYNNDKSVIFEKYSNQNDNQSDDNSEDKALKESQEYDNSINI